jgi:DNA polymerase elongation subunit (family B)
MKNAQKQEIEQKKTQEEQVTNPRKPRKHKRHKYYAAKTLRGDDEIIFAAFDTETEGLGGKLLMIQWGIWGKVDYATGPDMVARFFDVLLDHPAPIIWYAHFAQYDWRYLMDYIIIHELDVEIGMRTDNDIYEIRIKRDDGKTCIMRDSFALWNSSLEKLAESFCPEIPKLKIDIQNFDPQNPEHITYAKRDVEILLKGLPRLDQKIHEHFGVHVNATTASTALKAWQRTLGADQVYDATEYGERELFIREAYYGGLVFLTDTATHHDCLTFDINSSYPYVMCEYGVPYGREMESHDYCESIPGIYRVRVKTPESLIVPILPARNEKGAMRWYRGIFDTVVTNRELIFAANHGYEILEVYEGICWEEMVYPFNALVEKCKSLRKQYKGQPEELLAKLMQNSLYGKFGSRRERREMYAAHAMADGDFADAAPYDESGDWYIKKALDITGRTLPAWAVFITAHARLRLLQAIYSVGVENVIYGDTDSITIKRGHEDTIDTGNEYGQFKLEKEWSEFRAIAPKVYSGILKDGTRKGAAKGLPRKNLTEKHWKELLEDGTTSASVLSLDSLRVSIKNGVRPARTLTRASSTLENSQNYEVLTSNKIALKVAS